MKIYETSRNLRELRTQSDIEMYENCARLGVHEGVDVRCSEEV